MPASSEANLSELILTPGETTLAELEQVWRKRLAVRLADSARQLRERWDQIQAQRVRDRRRGGERAADSSPAPARPRPPAPPPPPPEDRGGPATLAELRALQASVGVAKE